MRVLCQIVGTSATNYELTAWLKPANRADEQSHSAIRTARAAVPSAVAPAMCAASAVLTARNRVAGETLPTSFLSLTLPIQQSD